MTLTLLDLYNSAATQEWSMYDNDVTSSNELDNSLVLAINKATIEILYSHPFSFREKTHLIITIPNINEYNLPKGIISRDNIGNFSIKINSHPLTFTKNFTEIKTGIPDEFLIKGEKLYLNPIPKEKSIITIDYITLAIGENKSGEEIFALKNETDFLYVPEHLEELLKNAIITRTMLNSIASESDENYSAYKKQSEIAYRLLVKYSKGVGHEKMIRIWFIIKVKFKAVNHRFTMSLYNLLRKKNAPNGAISFC